MLLNPMRPCPKCGAIVPNRKPFAKPFKCVRCGVELQASRRQDRIQGLSGLPIAFVLALGFGYRGWALVGMTLLLYLPAGFLVFPLVQWLWPTRLEPYDGKRILG